MTECIAYMNYLWLELRLLIGIKLLSAALSIWPEGWGKAELAQMYLEVIGMDDE